MGSQSEAAPVLRTKLRRPALATDLVLRHRLTELMARALETPLTLVSAPAGYGKSTLVSQWMEGIAQAGAWLSLDERDGDLRRFMEGLVAALDTAAAGACHASRELLEASELPPADVVTALLLNELDALERPCVIVLDDYHHLDLASPVHELLSGLLDHPSARIHLVLITRRDPPLPLTRLRARGQITEIRLRELSFSREETAELMATGEFDLARDDLEAVHKEVEGWAVGLRLVVLALGHATDPGSVLGKLRGGVPQVQEFLLEEVLDGQSPGIRTCILKASILDRFSSGLLDAVCPEPDAPTPPDLDAHDFLHFLRTRNLFLIPLDAHDEWYRYHHLFQDLLRRQLRRHLAPDVIATLHARASAWFEGRALIEEAIQHALASGDAVLGAEIVERNQHEELNRDRWYSVQRWLDMLPEAVIQERPALLLTEGWIASCRHQMARLPAIVDRCDLLLPDAASEPRLSGELSALRGNILFWEGRVRSTCKTLEGALALLAGQDPRIESEAELLLGLARCMGGSEALAIRTLEDRVRGHDSRDSYSLSRLIAGLVFIHMVSGDLPRARAEAQRLQLVAGDGGIRNAEAWSSYMIACTHLHANELAAASRHFEAAARQRYVLETRASIDAMTGLALCHQLMHHPEEAANAAGRLEQFAREMGGVEYLPLTRSLGARLALLRGDIPAALEWARTETASPTFADLFIWLEVPAITRARVLAAVGSSEGLDEAVERLQEIRAQSEACRLTCRTIEIDALQALVLMKQGREEEALDALGGAVSQASPGGWIRPFVEAGPDLCGLLPRLADAGHEVDHIHRILAATPGEDAPVFPDERPAHLAKAGSAETLPPGCALTNREVDILELLARRLSNKEIAAKLFISTYTVNDHLKHIYRKLGVNTRRQAVSRALEVGILSSDPS